MEESTNQSSANDAWSYSGNTFIRTATTVKRPVDLGWTKWKELLYVTAEGMPQITHAVCVHVWTVVDLMWFKREREPKLASKASHWSTALLTAETFKRTDHPYAAILLLEACFLRGAGVSEIPSPSQTGSVAFALWSSGVVNLHSHSGPFPLVCLLVYMFQSSSPSVAFLLNGSVTSEPHGAQDIILAVLVCLCFPSFSLTSIIHYKSVFFLPLFK